MPILLASIVMIAGIYAFVPVEQASTVHTTIATDIDNQNRAMTFALNMTQANGQIQLIAGETGQTITGTYVLSSLPGGGGAGAGSGVLECGLTDGGTGVVSGTNSTETGPASGTLANLGSGEGIKMQVMTETGAFGVCQATIIIDTFADG